MTSSWFVTFCLVHSVLSFGLALESVKKSQLYFNLLLFNLVIFSLAVYLKKYLICVVVKWNFRVSDPGFLVVPIYVIFKQNCQEVLQMIFQVSKLRTSSWLPQKTWKQLHLFWHKHFCDIWWFLHIYSWNFSVFCNIWFVQTCNRSVILPHWNFLIEVCFTENHFQINSNCGTFKSRN